MGRMKKRKAESGKRERRGDPCGRPGARRTDCRSQCARWLRNDGLFARGAAGRRDTWVPPYNSVFCRAGPACPAGDVGKPGRADVGIGPYEKGCRGGRPCPPGSACSLWCVREGLCSSRGRPRGSPLRTGTRSAVKRGVEDAAPYGGEQGVRRLSGGAEPPPPTHNGSVLQVRGDIRERMWAGQGEDGSV